MNKARNFCVNCVEVESIKGSGCALARSSISNSNCFENWNYVEGGSTNIRLDVTYILPLVLDLNREPKPLNNSGSGIGCINFLNFKIPY